VFNVIALSKKKKNVGFEGFQTQSMILWFYLIIQIVRAIAYRLQLPKKKASIHSVFHVSLLKKKVGSNLVVATEEVTA